jgi:hypothetical protein
MWLVSEAWAHLEEQTSARGGYPWRDSSLGEFEAYR